MVHSATIHRLRSKIEIDSDRELVKRYRARGMELRLYTEQLRNIKDQCLIIWMRDMFTEEIEMFSEEAKRQLKLQREIVGVHASCGKSDVRGLVGSVQLGQRAR